MRLAGEPCEKRKRATGKNAFFALKTRFYRYISDNNGNTVKNAILMR